MKKFLCLLGALVTIFGLSACDDKGPKDDLTKEVSLKFNMAYGNTAQTMTFNQGTPLTLPDGSVVSSGNLKPMWSYVANEINAKFEDITVQNAKSADMLQEAAATNFTDANIFGGNNLGDKFMSYGAQGKFVNLNEKLDYLPNFNKYLKDNPAIKSAITAYDGGIYHIPYIAEIGSIARAFTMRDEWVTKLLDNSSAQYDSISTFNTTYQGFWTGSNARHQLNGGTVTPKTGVSIVKETNKNIISIQNALSNKTSATMTGALIDYINENYNYAKPSELYLGEKAAYDIDELVALWRCLKLNPRLLTGSSEANIYPYFTRQGSYREEVLRFATYFDGVKAHGSDSYGARWYIDKDNKLQYTYSQESLYNVLVYLSQIQHEGLILPDIYTSDNASKNFRSILYGKHETSLAANAFGFMTYDFTASTTADGLNETLEGKNSIVGVLPPVSRVNGVWQYYMDNSRVIKPDGWAISATGSTEEQIIRALTLFDYFFGEEGSVLQNYALPDMLKQNEKYTGPDGIEYPAFSQYVLDKADLLEGGDLSKFLRNWLGCLTPVGFQKEIGFEYQYTSPNGFAAWELMSNSTLNIPTYAGTGIQGTNPNYYKLIPPVFSFTEKDLDNIGTTKMEISNNQVFEQMFNIIRFNYTTPPEGTVVHKSYSAYLAAFNDQGLEDYIKVYQAAYNRTK